MREQPHGLLGKAYLPTLCVIGAIAALLAAVIWIAIGA